MALDHPEYRLIIGKVHVVDDGIEKVLDHAWVTGPDGLIDPTWRAPQPGERRRYVPHWEGGVEEAKAILGTDSGLPAILGGA